MTASILVTGAAGYLGSHVALALAQAGFRVIGLDNLSGARRQTVASLQHLCGRALAFERADLRDAPRLLDVFARHRPAAVLHLATIGATRQPAALACYEVNVGGLTALLAAMSAARVHSLVFASRAAVYGAPAALPAGERARLAPLTPAARTLAIAEQMLLDLRLADPRWRVGVARLFDVGGAHDSGLIGRLPGDGADDLLTRALDATAGDGVVAVDGLDWPTADGSRVRDLVHVTEAADGLLRALEAVARGVGPFTVNLGSGRPCSDLQLVAALAAATRRPLAPRGQARRLADVAEIFADPTRARTLLGWSARLPLARICVDAWRARRLLRQRFSEVARKVPQSGAGSRELAGTDPD